MFKNFFIFLIVFSFFVSFSSAYSVEFFHSDHLGSPSVVSSGSGSVVWSADYDVFGETINEEGANKINYNSKERDATGLLYYGSRYYNPLTGRFITVDSVKGDHISTQSQNRYVYVLNNPLRYVDPTGNQGMDADKTLFNVHNFVIADGWDELMRPHIAEINRLSAQTGVPGEAILSALLVEDIRFYVPNIESLASWETLKGQVRLALSSNSVGQSILQATGHPVNYGDGSNMGMVHDDALINAVEYLSTLPDLDDGTRQLVQKFEKFKLGAPEDWNPEYFAFEKLSGPEKATFTLKAHMEYWKRNGHDLMDGDFNTISTFGERVGVLETLN